MKRNIIIILILLLGSFLRFVNLNDNSFWVDELDHYYVGQSINADGSFHLPSGFEYGRAKLYSYSVALSMRFFGYNEFGARLPSAIFGVLCLLIFYLIIKEFFHFRLAALSTFILAVIPFEIGFSRISRFYILLQLLTILCWYLFILALRENKEKSLYSRSLWIRSMGDINWVAMSFFIFVFLVALSIQVISAFLLVPFFVYIFILGIYSQLFNSGQPIYKNLYLMLSFGSLAIFTLLFIALPQFRELVQYGLSYKPYWATSGSAQDRFLFLKMIMGDELFPIGALFFLGFVQSIFRGNHIIFLGSLIFLSQIFLFTFVFSYRMFQYIYNVFPFLVLGGAYFLDNFALQEKETTLFKDKLSFLYRRSVAWLLIVSLIILFSPFFSRGLSTPFIQDGNSNGAVSIFEWKEASHFLKDRISNEDIVITSVPLTAIYYLGQADYIINMANYDLALKNDLRDKNGKVIDFYSGLPFIRMTSHLDSLKQNHKKGFLFADTYRMRQSQNFPQPIRNWIKENLRLLYLTKRQSIAVYGWENSSVF